MIFNFAETYYNEYFIAKSFLLLANIYEYQGNNFQAKATLESIIENYPEDDLINEARRKYEMLISKEQREQEKIAIESQSYIDILEDDIDYQLLYEEEDELLESNIQDSVMQDTVNKIQVQESNNQDTMNIKDIIIKPGPNDTIYFKDE